jgi:uncharacterized OsmC-like protein
VQDHELRAVQDPLKATYRENPAAAQLTLRAAAELGAEGVSCSVETGKALVEAGLHPASGGDGSLVCSGDMLLQALVACAGVTLRSVAVNRGIPITRGRVLAEGELDIRGTMAVSRDTPVGFGSIRLRFELASPAPESDLQALLEATERYCVVYQTLTAGVPVDVTHEQTA